MPLNVAVQMDPIERINVRGDSTFALLLEAQQRGHKLSYYTPDRLALRDGKVSAAVRPVEVRDRVGDHFTLGEPRHIDLSSLDVVLLRQDPPFDLAYISTTHMLERIHPRTLVVNDPAHVRNAPEKIFVTEFPDLMPPTVITRDLEAIKAFRAEQGDIVMKPLYGKGGEAVFRLEREDLNFGSLYDLFCTMFREPWVVQKFLPAVKDGDKRIILVDGEFAGAVNRVPAPDDLRSNMVRGGVPKATDLSAREREICARLGPPLRERGLLFVGIDVIDGFLTEINVTSPTGVRAVKNSRRARHCGAGLGQDREDSRQPLTLRVHAGSSSAFQACEGRPDRRKRSVFVLLRAEAVEIRTVRRIDRLQREIGKIFFKSSFDRPRLRDHESRNIPRVDCCEYRIQIIRALRHVGVDKVRRGDETVHAGAVVEGV